MERLVSGKKLLFLIFSATEEGGWEGEGLVIIFFSGDVHWREGNQR